MTDQDVVNYPDVLGAVTGGLRHTLDVVQCAMAVRPAQVPAGRTCELIVLFQNASDIDVDVVVQPDVPKRDKGNNKGRFLAKSNKLLVGLRPAEVGFVTLPVSVSPTTVPGAGYEMAVRIDIKRLAKNPQRVRDPKGGGPFRIEDLPEETQGHLEALRMLGFTVQTAGKNSLKATFDVLPPAIAALQKLEADWVSLWTMRDYVDEYTIARKVWPPAQHVLEQLSREVVFMPLLKATQERFMQCGYPLHPPEAIFITKLLTLLLEMGVAAPTPEDPKPDWPHWFSRLCRVLFQEPALANQVETLVARLIYADLVYDSVLYGFTMVGTVANENFGTEEETSRYADDIVDALTQNQPLGFARAYFPLVLAGLIANTRVTMPREQVRETVFILSKAIEKRQAEKNADNAFIFDIAQQLVDRALDVM